MRYENQNVYYAATHYIFLDDTALKKKSVQVCINRMLSGLHASGYKILLHKKVMDVLSYACKNSSLEETGEIAETLRYLNHLNQMGFAEIVWESGNLFTRVEDLILQYIKENLQNQPVLIVTQRAGFAFRVLDRNKRNKKIKAGRITDQGYIGKFVVYAPFHDGVGVFLERKWRRLIGMIKGEIGLALLKLKGRE